MDEKELEEKALQLFIEHGGTVRQEEFLAGFLPLLEGESAAENKSRLKKVIGQLADVKRQGNAKVLLLKSKYRLDTGLPAASPVHGLQSSILQALAKSQNDEQSSTSAPRSHLSFDDVLAIVGGESKSDAGVSVVAVSPEEDDGTSETVRRLSESTSLARMLEPLAKSEELVGRLPHVEVPLAENVKKEENLDAECEESGASESAGRASSESPRMPLDDSSVISKIPRAVLSSVSEPDLAQLNAVIESGPASVVHHSESDQNMIPGESTLRPHPIQQRSSVKDRAQLYQKDQAMSEAKSGVGGRPVSKAGPVASKSSRFGKQRDDGSDTQSVISMTLNDQQRRWILVSSSVQYQEMCKMLISCPELVNHVNFLNGYSALHWAAKKGHLDAIKLLAGAYAGNVNKKTGCTPLHLAAMHDHTDAMQLLVQTYGANPQIRDNSGRLPHQYLNNAFGTRRLTLAEKVRSGTSTPMRSCDAGRFPALQTASTMSYSLSMDQNRPGSVAGGFARMDSIRRAGAAALNMLRGQPLNARMSNGLGQPSPVEEASVCGDAARRIM